MFKEINRSDLIPSIKAIEIMCAWAVKHKLLATSAAAKRLMAVAEATPSINSSKLSGYFEVEGLTIFMINKFGRIYAYFNAAELKNWLNQLEVK